MQRTEPAGKLLVVPRPASRRLSGPSWAMDQDLSSRKNTMLVEAQITINGSKSAIWAAITDIENASEIMSGIEKIEIVEKPVNGLVGLKWKETRILFGKPATVEKWITDAAENEFYKTKAGGCWLGFVTPIRISKGKCRGLTFTNSHYSNPQTIGAKIKTDPMGLFFKGVIRKAALQDLNDIKAA